MKRISRALALWVAALLLAAAPIQALAAEEAGGQAVGKEEVVYINLNPDGSPDTVDVVNIFDLPQGGQIQDWGDYTSVRNMTTTDPLTLSQGQVTGQAGPGKLYYEGRLEDAQIPWDFTVAYSLDGAAIAAEDLAGRSGALQIRLTVEKNPGCAGTYFEDYALQISLTLDGDRASGIDAPGATVANVGGDKQITYTVLPGKGADVTLTAQVEDFAMDPIAINGVPLALDIDVDDSALMDQLTQLQQAAVDLDDGAAALTGGMDTLESGAGAVQEGSGTVSAGAASLQYGAAALAGGIQSLNDGTVQFQEGLTALTGQSAALTEGSAAMLEGLTQLQTAVSQSTVTPEQVTALAESAAALSGAVGELSAGVSALQESLGAAGVDVTALQTLIAGNSTAIERLTPYVSMMADVQQVIDLLNQDNAALGAVVTLASGLDSLVQEAAALQEGFDQFAAQANTLAGSLGSLPDSMGALKTGVDELVTSYTALDGAIAAYTAGADQLGESFGAIAEGAASLAEGSGTVSAGAASLQTGAGSLAAGAAGLAGGMEEIRTGAGQMKDGTAALREQTEGMDQQVSDQIDGMLSGVTGGGGRPVSFASEKNGQVDAVQFVIQVPAIKEPAPAEPEPEQAEEPSFWQKLAELFQ